MADRDHFTERTSSGGLANMGKSILAIPVGFLMFLGSLLALWKTEGCTDYARVAEESVAVDAAAPSGAAGRFVSVTGALGSVEMLGDPDFLAPGPWIELNRSVEMFAWTEKKETRTEKKVGGREEKITEYSYVKEWTGHPEPPSEFKRPEGHENPPTSWEDKEFSATEAKVGGWGFDPREADLPAGSPLGLADLGLVGKGLEAVRVSDTLTLARGTPEAPEIGDLRISFSALSPGATLTMFADAAADRLTAHVIDGQDRFFRGVSGGREEALASLRTEHKAKVWMGRIGGFLMMWIGMTMVFAPLHAVMDILPFMGRVSRGLVGCVTFPIAFILSVITTLIAVILHSWIALLLLAVGTIVGFAVIAKKKKASA